MGITEILGLLGGLALFLYGMQMMSDGLEAAAGNKMKKILEKLTSNRFLGVAVGAGVVWMKGVGVPTVTELMPFCCWLSSVVLPFSSVVTSTTGAMVVMMLLSFWSKPIIYSTMAIRPAAISRKPMI